MLRSMTGFGKVERELEQGSLAIEVRSENSRYLDISMRIPEMLEPLEEEMKRRLSNLLVRGRIKVAITLNGSSADKKIMQLNRELFERYHRLLREANEVLGASADVTLDHLLNFADIFEVKVPANDAEVLQPALFQALDEVVAEVRKMQNREGENLALEIRKRLDMIEKLVAQIHAISARNKENYLEKFKEKLRLLVNDLEVDDNRVLQEAALYVKRIDISEECVRLNSHIQQFRGYFNLVEPVGKRMTFLIQEMNREISTIGAKSEDAEISYLAVEVKNELEKIREQAQNIL